MTQEYYTAGRKVFQHITKEKTAQPEMLLKLKRRYTQEKMATLPDISRSTLNAEIARGIVERLDTRATPHKARLTALHKISLHFSRHIV